MCLAVPGKVISIDENKNDTPKMAKVDFAGVTKLVCVDWLPDVQIGDYVIVHVGFALNKLEKEEAEETLKLLREMGDIS